MRGYTGLNREPVQDGLAKRMHGFYPRPIVIIKDFGKQAAGALHHVLRRRFDTHFFQVFGQRLGADNGPVPQPFIDTIAHFCRGRTGIGNA